MGLIIFDTSLTKFMTLINPYSYPISLGTRRFRIHQYMDPPIQLKLCRLNFIP